MDILNPGRSRMGKICTYGEEYSPCQQSNPEHKNVPLLRLSLATIQSSYQRDSFAPTFHARTTFRSSTLPGQTDSEVPFTLHQNITKHQHVRCHISNVPTMHTFTTEVVHRPYVQKQSTRRRSLLSRLHALSLSACSVYLDECCTVR